eukprot:16142-Heterococcus_DN1.PRE.2
MLPSTACEAPSFCLKHCESVLDKYNMQYSTAQYSSQAICMCSYTAASHCMQFRNERTTRVMR